MRVISGTYKGRVLRSIRDPRVRPATGRVKESIFNILQNRISLQGARVLDLFAGSGSLGFEAISRGASLVVFVDEWQGAIKTIEENAKLLRCEDRCEIIRADVYKYLKRSVGEFDLVFVDPPYRMETAAELPSRIFERKLVSQNGLLIMEHAARLKIDQNELFKLTLSRTFGSTVVSFFVHTHHSFTQS